MVPLGGGEALRDGAAGRVDDCGGLLSRTDKGRQYGDGHKTTKEEGNPSLCSGHSVLSFLEDRKGVRIA